ncbi:hypothetical protein CPB86DRAFT_802425 [Serendipita vermifera]|nr:hypothetical protein CPB86DRAFT_802425 [Serendipita vermifera]
MGFTGLYENGLPSGNDANTLGIRLSHPSVVQTIGIAHSVQSFIVDGVEPPKNFRIWAVKKEPNDDIKTDDTTTQPVTVGPSLLHLGSFVLDPSTNKPAYNFTIAATGEVVRELIMEFIGGDSEKMCLYGVRVYGQVVQS